MQNEQSHKMNLDMTIRVTELPTGNRWTLEMSEPTVMALNKSVMTMIARAVGLPLPLLAVAMSVSNFDDLARLQDNISLPVLQLLVSIKQARDNRKENEHDMSIIEAQGLS